VALNDHVREVRSALTNPRALCEKLGLLKGAKPQAGDGVSICCPVHGERDPSCSVSRGPDGTIRVKCFACDFATDALGLIANVEGLSLRGEFRERVAAPEPAPLPEFPPQSEVEALWGAGIPTSADPDVWEYLRSRGFAPERLDESKLAVALPPKTKTPPWASYARQSWVETGHRILVPMWDKVGSLVTVRAWRVTDGDTPKRLPPKGHRATGCVMANPLALGMLRGQVSPVCLAYDRAVIGINSGSWCDEIARRVPNGTKVIINTHHDEAGERYADQVVATLGNRVAWWRSAP
jgi:hypothetical protein